MSSGGSAFCGRLSENQKRSGVDVGCLDRLFMWNSFDGFCHEAGGERDFPVSGCRISSTDFLCCRNLHTDLDYVLLSIHKMEFSENNGAFFAYRHWNYIRMLCKSAIAENVFKKDLIFVVNIRIINLYDGR